MMSNTPAIEAHAVAARKVEPLAAHAKARHLPPRSTTDLRRELRGERRNTLARVEEKQPRVAIHIEPDGSLRAQIGFEGNDRGGRGIDCAG
jgi:hypothetical protein